MRILRKGTYYGSEKSVWIQSGVVLSEYDYQIPKTDWHYHENPYFMYLLEGNLMDINKATRVHCPRGSLLFHNWQEPHFNSKESAVARGFHIEFDRTWYNEKELTAAIWEGSKQLTDPRLHQIVANIYYEFKCRDHFSSISLETLVQQLCLEVESKELHDIRKEPPWVAQLKQLIREDEVAPSLKALSNQLGIHPVHLSRALPKYLETSLGDYIRREKIRKSLGFLGSRDYSLSEVAYQCGFADQSHFIRIFKMYFNITPGTYRKRILR
jgi:AraC-like DNA-binding protein